MIPANVEEESVGEVPTPDDIELVAWAARVTADELKILQEALRQMVTLTAALLAGSAALVGRLPLGHTALTLVGAALLTALGAALWGSLPYSRRFHPQCIEEIREARDLAVQGRSLWLRVSTVALFAGMSLLIAGALFGL